MLFFVPLPYTHFHRLLLEDRRPWHMEPLAGCVCDCSCPDGGRSWQSLPTGRVSGVRGRGGERLPNGDEEIFLKNPFGIPSQKVSDSKLEKSVKNAADSSVQIPPTN